MRRECKLGQSQVGVSEGCGRGLPAVFAVLARFSCGFRGLSAVFARFFACGCGNGKIRANAEAHWPQNRCPARKPRLPNTASKPQNRAKTAKTAGEPRSSKPRYQKSRSLSKNRAADCRHRSPYKLFTKIAHQDRKWWTSLYRKSVALLKVAESPTQVRVEAALPKTAPPQVGCAIKPQVAPPQQSRAIKGRTPIAHSSHFHYAPHTPPAKVSSTLHWSSRAVH
jgi:hypothetical protein